MKFNPGPYLRDLALRVARRAAAQIQAGAPRVPHRDGKAPTGSPGGSLPGYIRRPDFVRWDRVKAVLQFHALGPEARWLKFGSVRQKARPFDTLPTPAEVQATVREIQAAAAQHYRRRFARSMAARTAVTLMVLCCLVWVAALVARLWLLS